MAKQKTKKSVAKRIKVTASGKLMHRLAFGRHQRYAKSSAQKRRYRKHTEVTNSRIVRRMRRMMALS